MFLDFSLEGKLFIKELFIVKFLDVFNGIGKFYGLYYLEIEVDVIFVVYFLRKVFIVIKF